MSLIVEDGTNVAGAESYCSVEFATEYHSNMGQSAWAAIASDTIREQVLRKATQYMLGAYRLRWNGYRQFDSQVLDWPRSNVTKKDLAAPAYYDQDTVPTEVKNACAELALRASSATLQADLGQQKKRVKVGPIETEYDQFSPQQARYPAVDAMLAPFFGRAAGTVTVVRS